MQDLKLTCNFKCHISLFSHMCDIYDLSFSNIQQFCGYIKQLPSLEEKSTKKKHITRKASKTEEDM